MIVSLHRLKNENENQNQLPTNLITNQPKFQKSWQELFQSSSSPDATELDKLSTTNYDFSPCISAALNVSGSGGTTE